MSSDIAVTVIGGYLGAGKTTLVNHVLRTADQRVAVLVNDFGDVDIDAELIESSDGDTISLANGCICCSLVDGLASALVTIKELDPRPERLVIEASGVADPATVAAYGHSPGLALDAVVVVVDAETVRRRSTDKYVGDTVVGQLASADIIVFNKVDLVDGDTAVTTRGWLRGRAPQAVIVDAERAQVPPAVLFGTVPAGVGTGAGESAQQQHQHPHLHDQADELFESWSWSSEDPIERALVEALMAELPDSVVRAKGILWLTDDDRPTVLQRVGARWTLRPNTSASAVRPDSRLVFIGMRNAVDEQWLAHRLTP